MNETNIVAAVLRKTFRRSDIAARLAELVEEIQREYTQLRQEVPQRMKVEQQDGSVLVSRPTDRVARPVFTATASAPHAGRPNRYAWSADRDHWSAPMLSSSSIACAGLTHRSAASASIGKSASGP